MVAAPVRVHPWTDDNERATEMNTEEMAELGVYRLASLAECASPDSTSSDGARFLDRVRYAVIEEIERGVDDDSAFEIADAAVPVYTAEVWRTFVDLAAYQEDPTELGADASDMEQAAKVCLLMIAERLALALFDEAADDEPEGDDDE